MDYKVLKQEQATEAAANVLKNRAMELAKEQIGKELEVKRLQRVSETVDEGIAELLVPQVEGAVKEQAKTERKLERARVSTDLSDAEIKAARIEILAMVLGKTEGEYAAHSALADERKRVIESGQLDEEELALVQRHWQENQLAMQSLEATHDVVLAEFETLKLDPTKLNSAPDAPVPGGGVIPLPDPPQPPAAKVKKATKATA